MRFAHISDSHLGCRQFGLLDREKDFYYVFDKTIDKIIEEDVDFVIHSGDLFDSNRPSTEALLTFQKALLKLNEANIPVYAIAGNHDTILRKDALPPQVLFRDLGLNIISQNNPIYQNGAVMICGVPYTTNSEKNVLLEIYQQLSDLTKTALRSILVSHQGIGKWMHEDSYEIELDELPRTFDYYAIGHHHNFYIEDYGKGKLVSAGAMEINRVSECNENFNEFGKGFCIVEFTDEATVVERVNIDLPRKFFNEIIDYDKLDERLSILEEKLKSLDNKPIVDITVLGGDFDSAAVYEIIQERIGDYVLSLRPTFKPDKVLIDERLIDGSKTLDPKSLLFKIVDEKFGREEVSKLSIDLLDSLSNNQIGEAKHISDNFYGEYYYKQDEEDINTESDGSGFDEFGSGSDGSVSDDAKSDSLDDYLNKNLDSKKEVSNKEDSKKVKTKELSLDNF